MPNVLKPKKVRVVPIDWIDVAEGKVNLMDDPPFTPGQMVIANSIVSALLAGMNGLAAEIQEHFEAFARGEISGTEYAAKVAQAGSQKAALGGGKAAAAFTLQELVKVLSDKMGKAAFRRFARSNVMTLIAFGVVDQGIDTYKYYQGELKVRDYQINSVANVGSACGAASGGAIGAMLGSFVPGIGTLLGATFGSYFGSYGGTMAGRSLGEQWFENPEAKEDDTPPEEGAEPQDIEIE